MCVCEGGALRHGTAVGSWWDPGALMSQAAAYHTWPKPRSTPTFPGNLATGWTLVETQGGQRPYGTSPCCLCSWGCSGCSPSVPSPAPPRVPTGDGCLWGARSPGRPHAKLTVLLCPLQSPSPRSPQGCPRRVPALARGVHRGVPVAQGTCTAGAGVLPGVCV